MESLDSLLNKCNTEMGASVGYNKDNAEEAMRKLLSKIIENPKTLTVFYRPETLAVTLSNILRSDYPDKYDYIDGINTRRMIFATGFYLFMYQIATGYFLDKDWPAFVSLIHNGRMEFAHFIMITNPFAPELRDKILGKEIDNTRCLTAVKGIELNMMLAANNKGFLNYDIKSWYDELIKERDKLLEIDHFSKEAIPLFDLFSKNIKLNDITFVNKNSW